MCQVQISSSTVSTTQADSGGIPPITVRALDLEPEMRNSPAPCIRPRFCLPARVKSVSFQDCYNAVLGVIGTRHWSLVLAATGLTTVGIS